MHGFCKKRKLSKLLVFVCKNLVKICCKIFKIHAWLYAELVHTCKFHKHFLIFVTSHWRYRVTSPNGRICLIKRFLSITTVVVINQGQVYGVMLLLRFHRCKVSENAISKQFLASWTFKTDISVFCLSYSVFFNAKHFSENLSTYSVETIDLSCTLLEVLIDPNQKLERTCTGGFVSSFIHSLKPVSTNRAPKESFKLFKIQRVSQYTDSD